MQLTFDPSNPAEVAAVLSLIGAPAAAAPGTPPATRPAPPPGAPAAAAAAPAITRADFAAAVQRYATANSPKATKALLAEFGFASISNVTDDKFAAIMAKMG